MQCRFLNRSNAVFSEKENKNKKKQNKTKKQTNKKQKTHNMNTIVNMTKHTSISYMLNILISTTIVFDNMKQLKNKQTNTC